MRLIDADRLLDRCKFYHLPNGDLAVPIIDVQHAPTIELPDINVGNMDTISRQQAIDALRGYLVGKRCPDDGTLTCRLIENEVINKLPSAQPKQNEMIKEIRRWINSGNRGNADYFIVDRIEEIINLYEIN